MGSSATALEESYGQSLIISYEIYHLVLTDQKLCRLEVLCIQELRKQRKTKGKRCTFIFPGPPENYIHAAPPMDFDNRPWSLCVSMKWQREFGEELTFKETDDKHSVLKLDIPDDMFDAESMVRLRVIEEDEGDAVRTVETTQ